MKDEIQGVLSVIEFPLGQDEVAIGKAINDLLCEGWNFRSLTKTHICFSRKWEANLNQELLLLSVSGRMPKKREFNDKFAITDKTPKEFKWDFRLENAKVIAYNLCHDEFTAWIVGRMEEIEKVIKSSELNADARAWQVEAYSDKFGTIDYVKGEEHSKRTIDNLATAIKTMILGGEK